MSSLFHDVCNKKKNPLLLFVSIHSLLPLSDKGTCEVSDFDAVLKKTHWQFKLLTFCGATFKIKHPFKERTSRLSVLFPDDG